MCNPGAGSAPLISGSYNDRAIRIQFVIPTTVASIFGLDNYSIQIRLIK